jgi:hypothetical protein
MLAPGLHGRPAHGGMAIAEDQARILEGFTTQFDRVVGAASSIARFAEMIREQGTKGWAPRAKVGEAADNPSEKAACKAFEAPTTAPGAAEKPAAELNTKKPLLRLGRRAIGAPGHHAVLHPAHASQRV